MEGMNIFAIVLCTVAIVGGFGSGILMWAYKQKEAETMDAEVNGSYHLPDLPSPITLYRQRRQAQSDWAAAQSRARRSQDHGSRPVSPAPSTTSGASSELPFVYNNPRVDQVTSIRAPIPAYHPDYRDTEVMEEIRCCPAYGHPLRNPEMAGRSRSPKRPAFPTDSTPSDCPAEIPSVYDTRRRDQATPIQAPAPIYQPDSWDAEVMDMIRSCPSNQHFPHHPRLTNRTRSAVRPARSSVQSLDLPPPDDGRRTPAGSWLSRLLQRRQRPRPATQSTDLQLMSRCQNPFREDLSGPDPFLEQAMGPGYIVGQGYAYGMGGVRDVG